MPQTLKVPVSCKLSNPALETTSHTQMTSTHYDSKTPVRFNIYQHVIGWWKENCTNQMSVYVRALWVMFIESRDVVLLKVLTTYYVIVQQQCDIMSMGEMSHTRGRCLQFYSRLLLHSRISPLLSCCLANRDVRFVSILGQIGPKLDKSGTFSGQISVHFGAERQKSDLKKSRICPIWGQSDPV